MKLLKKYLFIFLFYFPIWGYSQNQNSDCHCKILYQQYKDSSHCSPIPFTLFVQHEYWKNNILIISKGGMFPLQFNFESFIPIKLKKDTFRIENGVLKTNMDNENKDVFSIKSFNKKDTTYYYSVWPYGFLDILYVYKFEFIPIKKKLVEGNILYKYSMTKSVFGLTNGNELIRNKDSLMHCLYEKGTINLHIMEEPNSKTLYFIPDSGFIVDACLENDLQNADFKHWIQMGDCKKYLREIFSDWYQ
jgi:hypothetical protein